MIKSKPSISTKKEETIFKTYNEAMEDLFPNIWEQEKQESKKEKREVEVMKELAGSVLSHF